MAPSQALLLQGRQPGCSTAQVVQSLQRWRVRPAAWTRPAAPRAPGPAWPWAWLRRAV